MSNLRRAAAAAAIDLTVDDQAAADAGADRDVEDRRQPLAGAEERFGQTGDIGVVAQYCRPTQQLGDPISQGKIVPIRDLMRLDDGARGVVDRSAEADADTANVRPLQLG